MKTLTIDYDESLPLAMGETPSEFENEALVEQSKVAQ